VKGWELRFYFLYILPSFADTYLPLSNVDIFHLAALLVFIVVIHPYFIDDHII